MSKPYTPKIDSTVPKGWTIEHARDAITFVKIQWAGNLVVVYDPATGQDLFTVRAHRDNLPAFVSLELNKRGLYTDQIGVDREGKLRIWI